MSALLQTLGLVCPACDLYNPARSSQCRECGAALASTAAPSRPPPARVQAAPAPPPAAAPSVGPTAGRAPMPARAAPAAAVPSAPAAPPPAAARSRPTPTGSIPAPAAARRPPAPAPVHPQPLADAAAARADAFPPGMRPAARPPAPAPVPRPSSTSETVPAIPASELLKKASAPPAAAARPAAPVTPSRFGLTVVAGGSAGQRFRLGGAGCMVGRARGAILFPDDIHLAPHHATFLLRDGKLFVRDESSLSGVFVSVGAEPELLPAGGFFAAGQRLFRYMGALPIAPPVAAGRPRAYGAPIQPGQPLYSVEEILVGGRSGRTVLTSGPLLTIGQQHCDLCFPGDSLLAPRHCELTPGTQAAQLRDLSGGLGTFVRIPAATERPLNPGDRVRVGLQILQVEVAG
jgi:pSer/pThr/pTyr-binding forkhead associated (FHA) protein